MVGRKVEEELLQRLKTGQYSAGEKLPSIREMCGEFNCSYVMVFRAVQALKRQGCLETVKGSGTFVVRDLQKHLEKKLLIYIFDKPECRQLNPGDSLRYTCFQRTVRKSGFMDLALQEDDVLEPEEMNEVAGALITLRSPMMEELIARKIPCVFISSLGNHYGMPCVTPDFYQGATLVLRHLLETGARRIQALTIDAREYNQASYAPRLQAYRAFCASAAGMEHPQSGKPEQSPETYGGTGSARRIFRIERQAGGGADSRAESSGHSRAGRGQSRGAGESGVSLQHISFADDCGV